MTYIWIVLLKVNNKYRFINHMWGALLEHQFQTGEAFNKDIIKFASWKRWVMAQKRAMRARRPPARARRRRNV